MIATQPTRMPVLFVGHGNPMKAIEDNAFRRTWEELGRTLPRPKAILCISAHWETPGVFLTATPKPETIHDFYGFPKALFDVQYPAPGDASLARRIKDRIQSVDAGLDAERGLDHGAWSVLLAMYPLADVPVVQLSLDTRQPGSFHYRLGKELHTLRDEGVLVMGSGNAVHNLSLFSFRDPAPLDWAVQCDAEIRKRIIQRDHAVLLSGESLVPHFRLAVPTPEHYYPLLYALALRDEGDSVSFFNSSVLSSISMTSVLIGSAAPELTAG